MNYSWIKPKSAFLELREKKFIAAAMASFAAALATPTPKEESK